MADILKQNKQNFFLRLDSFLDKKKNRPSIHLSLWIPDDMQNYKDSHGYFVDFVGRNQVNIGRGEYQIPYDISH
ncbi:MAG: hypothetical protein GXP45_04110 [bacterium]|nr:hypothetical protein [bacterium]